MLSLKRPFARMKSSWNKTIRGIIINYIYEGREYLYIFTEGVCQY